MLARTKLILGIVLVFVVVLAVIDHSASLLDTVVTPPELFGARDAAIADIRTLLTLASAFLLFGLVWAARLFDLALSSYKNTKDMPDPAQQEIENNPLPERISKCPYRSWATGFLIALVTVSGFIVYVDPYDFYGTDAYESSLLRVRGFKADTYADLPQVPNIVITGSSHAFRFSPAYITETIGYSAFNAAVEGGNLADALMLTKFISDQHNGVLPEVLLVEADPPLGADDHNIVTQAPLHLIPYMEVDTALSTVETRTEGLFELSQLAEAVFIARTEQLYGVPKTTVTLRDDGVVERYANPAKFETRLESHMNTGRVLACRQLNDDGVRIVNDLVSWAEDNDVSIVFYSTPRHPVYYDAFMGDNPGYMRCDSIYTAFMQDLMESHDNIFLANYTRLDSIGGIDTAEGYYDAHHMTPFNSNLWIDAAADTIQEAYEVAAQRRSAH